MSGNPRERARQATWKVAGQLLLTLRERRGYSVHELARRAGVSADLLAAYEAGRERFPAFEACWRLTTALGVDLLTFVRQAQGEAGVSLLDDVTPPQARRPASAPPAAEEQGELRAFVGQFAGDKADKPTRPA